MSRPPRRVGVPTKAFYKACPTGGDSNFLPYSPYRQAKRINYLPLRFFSVPVESWQR